MGERKRNKDTQRVGEGTTDTMEREKEKRKERQKVIFRQKRHRKGKRKADSENVQRNERTKREGNIKENKRVLNLRKERCR
jgi:hypothetical protein